jgi:DNA-binding LacI/PurR family transcriptional regulator
MAKIAADLGISPMSVSLALRGRHGVSQELRERVLAHAKSLGYSPDPLAAELMARMRSRRVQGTARETIAYIDTFSRPGLLHEIPTFRLFHEGAVARGHDFGYGMEIIRAREPGMSAARLGGILKARGIRGVLVGPRWWGEPDVELDWPEFSAVLIGEVNFGPKIHRVCNNHTHTCALALKSMSLHGYRRIGLVMLDAYEASRSYDFTAGVDRFRRENPDSPTSVEVKFFHDWDEKKSPAECVRWISEQKFDAVVSLTPEAGRCVVQMNASDKKNHIGYAILDWQEGSDWAGVDQNPREIGATAMEMLRSLMLDGERGVSQHPRTVLVDGEWRDGTTARTLPA